MSSLYTENSVAVDAEIVSSCPTDNRVMCRAGSTERSRRQPVTDNNKKVGRVEVELREGCKKCKDCAAKPVAIASTRICMIKSYSRSMKPMRAKGTRKRKSFVVEVKTGEAESPEVSKMSADAVPSFVG